MQILHDLKALHEARDRLVLHSAVRDQRVETAREDAGWGSERSERNQTHIDTAEILRIERLDSFGLKNVQSKHTDDHAWIM